MISYAQNFEDVILSRALSHIREGFYVDIGANHPVEDSVSLAFYERGWRGVHVEPSSDFASQLRLARLDEVVIQAAIGATPGKIEFFEFNQSGLSTASPEVARLHGESGLHSSETTVDCITLAQLLNSYSHREIHWLKIDVEGYEGEVIRSWAPSSVRPWILCIEAVDPVTHVDVSARWEPLIVDLGYAAVYFDGLNKFYLSEDHGELRRHFLLPPNLFDGFVLSGTATSSFNKSGFVSAKKGTTNPVVAQQL